MVKLQELETDNYLFLWGEKNTTTEKLSNAYARTSKKTGNLLSDVKIIITVYHTEPAG